VSKRGIKVGLERKTERKEGRMKGKKIIEQTRKGKN
jgi:hypothetical protein